MASLLHYIFILALVLGAWLPALPASTPVTVIVHTLDGQPESGLTVDIVDAAGQVTTLTTDAAGQVTTIIQGPTVWLRQVVADGVALQLDSNTPDGGLRLPLDGTPLVLGFTRDATLLFRAPQALDNPAFPHGVPGSPAGAAAPAASEASPVPTVTADTGDATAGDRPDPLPLPRPAGQPESDVGAFWPIVAGMILLGVALGRWAWTRVRRTGQPRRDPRRRGGR
ncbi:hypothetical protein EKD04_017900 [Chloroflexales bacterium ZM16-3]|nr:hypothetical protein [Chloroflexales bacterium ZM16-3]